MLTWAYLHFSKIMRLFRILSLLMVFCGIACAADAGSKIKVLLITGGHGFENRPFFQVFQENAEIDFTPVEHAKTSATAYERDDLLTYDVVVLYDMPKVITDAQK